MREGDVAPVTDESREHDHAGDADGRPSVDHGEVVSWRTWNRQSHSTAESQTAGKNAIATSRQFREQQEHAVGDEEDRAGGEREWSGEDETGAELADRIGELKISGRVPVLACPKNSSAMVEGSVVLSIPNS